MTKTIGIIGYGHFGQFIELISKKYFPEVNIKIASRSRENDGKKFFDLNEVLKSDAIFLTMPIRHLAKTIADIAPKISNDTILVDVATIKELPESEIKKYPNLKYICTHPMFGPTSYEKIGQKLDGLKLVLTSHNLNIKEYEALKIILIEKLKLDLVEMSSKEHDKLIAKTLFLTHFISQSILRTGYGRTNIDTLSHSFLMSAVESVKNDTELFKDVYKYNKYCQQVAANFADAVQQLETELDRD